MFVVTVDFRVKPGQEAAFAEAVARQAANSLAGEAGCHRFDVCRDPADGAHVFLYEIYSDRASFDAHLASAHFLDFDATVADWLASKEVATWELQAPPARP